MNKFCFMDTETTGTDCNIHGLIQVAGMILYEASGILEEKETFDFKIKPMGIDKIDEPALQITGLDIATINSYPDAEEIKTQMDGLFSRHVSKYDKQDKFFLIGYNARFDYDFLRMFYVKLGDKYFGSFFWFPPIDVMNLAIVRLLERRKNLPNFKLATVATAFGLSIEGALHDALNDIRLTKMLYEHLTKKEGV